MPIPHEVRVTYQMLQVSCATAIRAVEVVMDRALQHEDNMARFEESRAQAVASVEVVLLLLNAGMPAKAKLWDIYRKDIRHFEEIHDVPHSQTVAKDTIKPNLTEISAMLNSAQDVLASYTYE